MELNNIINNLNNTVNIVESLKPEYLDKILWSKVFKDVTDYLHLLSNEGRIKFINDVCNTSKYIYDKSEELKIDYNVYLEYHKKIGLELLDEHLNKKI